MIRKFQLWRVQLARLGLRNWIKYKIVCLRARNAPKGQLFGVHTRLREDPLYFRAQTSDRDVFHQIIINDEYRCLNDVVNPQLIIDCGANVGYSSAYMLARFPHAHVICIEPDRGNFELLERNLARYKDRCTLIASGVWSSEVGLVISEEPFGDGREWSFTVREARPGEPATMTSIDIGTLIERSGFERVSILKVDVEGAERNIFASNCAWLSNVDNLVIELHSEECVGVVHRAIVDQDFVPSRCDELYVFKRRTPPAAIGSVAI